jgi:hypothetical protein
MMNILSKIINSNNDLKKQILNELIELDKQQKQLKNDNLKIYFESLLKHSLAELNFKTKNGVNRSIVCTNDPILISHFSINKKNNKKKIVKTHSSLKCSDKNCIKTWDLIDNKEKTINLKNCSIPVLIPLKEEYLAELIKILDLLLTK